MTTTTESIDVDKLYFPVEIVEVIGLSKNEIAFMKRKGCPFYGKKTCVRWVRDFLAIEAGASQSSPAQSGRPEGSAEYKSGAPSARSGSRAASPRTR